MDLMFVHKNLWRLGTLAAPSSEHPQFPASDSQIDTLKQSWRSRYGTGSGNGYFSIVAEVLGSEILANGAFTSDVTGWTGAYATLASVAGGQSGNCLELTRTGGALQSAFPTIFNTTPGVVYKVTAYIKSGTSGAEQAKLQAYTDGYVLLGEAALTTTGTWTVMRLYFTATTATSYVFLVKNSATAGTMLFDTVSVKPVTVAGNAFADFDEGGLEFSFALTAGTYNGTTLAAELKAQLDAAGALTYTVTYDESTGKYTIAATGNFTLRWNTGAHHLANAGATLGFATAADDTGAATYTSDVRVNHTSEFTNQNDLGAAEEYDFVALIGHNLSSAAVITLFGADDSSWTNLVSDAVTWTTGSIFFKLPAARTKQILHLQIVDPANAAGYIEIKTIVVGKSWTSNRNFTQGFARGPESHSTAQFSDSIVSHGQDKPRPKTWSLGIRGLNSASELLAEDLLDVCDILYGFLICLDATSAATITANTYFVMLAVASRPVNESYDYFNWALELREVQ